MVATNLQRVERFKTEFIVSVKSAEIGWLKVNKNVWP